jgi:transcription antitermination factor NusG
MASALLNIRTPTELPKLTTEDFEPHWYAAYTCANHEKRVAIQLEQKSLVYFLPLYDSVRKWKDRKVYLQMPLFPGYVLVRLALQHRLQVLQIPSVVRLVGFNGWPTPLPDDEIEALRNGLAQGLRVEPHQYLTVGRRVRIVRGAFCGLEGILLRKKGHLRVLLSLNLIQRSLILDISAADVLPIATPKVRQDAD